MSDTRSVLPGPRVLLAFVAFLGLATIAVDSQKISAILAHVPDKSGPVGQVLAWISASFADAGYSLRTTIRVVHLLGLVLGMGAVMFLDIYLLRYLLIQPLTPDALRIARFGSQLSKYGLIVLWLSGLSFLAIYWVESPDKLANPKVWSKMTIVAALTLNGCLIHTFLLPMLELKPHRKILDGEPLAMQIAILVIAAVSIASWMFAVVLGVSAEFNFSHAATVLLGTWLMLAAISLGVMMIGVGVMDRPAGKQGAAHAHDRAIL